LQSRDGFADSDMSNFASVGLPRRDAWHKPEVRHGGSVSAAACNGGRLNYRTRRRRQQRRRAFRRLQSCLSNEHMRPPPGLEELAPPVEQLRTPGRAHTYPAVEQLRTSGERQNSSSSQAWLLVCTVAAVVLEHCTRIFRELLGLALQRWQEARAKIRRLQQELMSVEAMAEAAIFHALEAAEEEATEAAESLVDGLGNIATAEVESLVADSGNTLGASAADNPMDVIYEVLLKATYKEMSTSKPAFVPVELVADMARIPEFEDWLQCWMAVPNGMLRKDCVALIEFPSGGQVEEC